MRLCAPRLSVRANALSVTASETMSMAFRSYERCQPGLKRREPSTLALAVRTFSFPDRKSTRLNSSHDQISYAVFCLKKKKKKKLTLLSVKSLKNTEEDSMKAHSSTFRT